MNCLFAGEDCRGRIQLHHVVSRQRIRRAWNTAIAEHRRGGHRPWLLGEATGGTAQWGAVRRWTAASAG